MIRLCTLITSTLRLPQNITSTNIKLKLNFNIAYLFVLRCNDWFAFSFQVFFAQTCPELHHVSPWLLYSGCKVFFSYFFLTVLIRRIYILSLLYCTYFKNYFFVVHTQCLILSRLPFPLHMACHCPVQDIEFSIVWSLIPCCYFQSRLENDFFVCSKLRKC